MVARSRSDELPIVRILDFGLARFESEGDHTTRLTQLGQIVGTVDYTAPEQSQNARMVDIRADIYSLGCSLFYLLTGNPPFPGDGALERISARVLGDVPSVCKSRREVPLALDQVIAKTTARNPIDRYQTPLEVVQALAPFVKQGAMPKASPELSSGATEGKSAVKMAALANPPPSPAAEAPKQQQGASIVWESLTESSAASVELRKSQVIRKPQAATGRGRTARVKWLIGGSAAIGVLLLALLGRWAGGERQPIRVSSVPESATESKSPNVPVQEEENDGLIDSSPYLSIHFHNYHGHKVLPEPSMRFGLLAKDPDHPGRKKKLAGDDDGLTNNTVLLVDGRQFLFGEVSRPKTGFDESDPPGKWLEMEAKLQGEIAGRPRDGRASSWLLPGRKLKVTQEVEVVPSRQSRRLDTCLVRYLLENQDTVSHRVGIRFMLDTNIGNNDGGYFAISGYPDLCDTWREFETHDQVPDFIQSLEKDDLRDPGTVTYLQFRIGKNIESANSVLLGGWPNGDLKQIGIPSAKAQDTGWKVPFISMKMRIGNDIITDSAVTMYWNVEALEPGKTRVVGFAYGLTVQRGFPENS